MNASDQPVFRMRRGAIAAILAVGLAATTVCLLVVWNAYRDDIFRRPAMIRSFGGLWTKYDEWIGPLVGCAAVAAGTGWAAFAPRGRYRIASTLAIVTVGTAMCWSSVVLLFPPAPTQVKRDRTQPVMNLSEALFTIVPPLLVGGTLSVVRAVRSAARPVHRTALLDATEARENAGASPSSDPS